MIFNITLLAIIPKTKQNKRGKRSSASYLATGIAKFPQIYERFMEFNFFFLTRAHIALK